MSYDCNDMVTAYGVADLACCYAGKVGCIVRVPGHSSIITAYNKPLFGYSNCFEAGGCLLRSDGTKQRCVRTVHAEMAAVRSVIDRGLSLEGCVFIQTKMPCLSCAKLLALMGVQAVYYVEPNTTLPSVGVEMLLPLRIIRVDDPRKGPR